MTPETQNIYAQRRRWLLEQVEADSVIILVGNQQQVRNKNILFPFRQDHDFYYLTGYAEPDAVAVLRPDTDMPYILFNQPKDEFQEVWFGARAGQQGAMSHYAADQAYDIAEFEQRLPELLGTREHVYVADETGRFSHRVTDWLRQQRTSVKFDEAKVYKHLHSPLPFIHNKRVIKEGAEIELIRHAVNASVEGHKHVMSLCRPGITETHLSGAFMGKIAEFGCHDVGYPNIVASGNNACCLHYDICTDITQEGQMLLVDAGGDYRYYTADITRSYPVNGRFSAPQRDIYQLVLASLDAAIETAKPGNCWNGIYTTAMGVLTQGLMDLKLLKGSYEQLMETEAYKPFTLHKTGHWMGLDVHDVGAYHDNQGNWLTLTPNMVFTIEPGLYFPAHREDVPESFRGMGVRIEDDILVTSDGNENLSKDAPRTVADLEAIIGSA